MATAEQLGVDIDCLSGHGLSWGLASGSRNVANAIGRRLITPRGGLFYDPDYGFDTREYLGVALTRGKLAELIQGVESEALKDVRVQAAVASVSATGNPSTSLALELSVTLADGPVFDLILTIQALVPGAPTVTFSVAGSDVPPSGLIIVPAAPAAPLFTPLALGSTLKALYEGPGIIQSAGIATAWNDSSGNGSHLTAGTVGTYVANAGHGLPAVSFNGTTQYFTSSVIVTSRSFFAVVGAMNNPTGPACLCGAGRIYAQLGVANQMGVYVTPTFVTSGQTYNTARHSIAIIQRSPTDIDFYLDGAKVNANTGTAFFMDTQLSMGATETGGQFSVATVEHMSICDTPLSNADVANMLGYLNRVYGV